MQCACCGRQLEIKSTWKSTSNRLYCSEFCAESEISEAAQATLLQLHVDRPYERLERLLPYMRLYSGRSLSNGDTPVTPA